MASQNPNAGNSNSIKIPYTKWDNVIVNLYEERTNNRVRPYIHIWKRDKSISLNTDGFRGLLQCANQILEAVDDLEMVASDMENCLPAIESPRHRYHPYRNRQIGIRMPPEPMQITLDPYGESREVSVIQTHQNAQPLPTHQVVPYTAVAPAYQPRATVPQIQGVPPTTTPRVLATVTSTPATVPLTVPLAIATAAHQGPTTAPQAPIPVPQTPTVVPPATATVVPQMLQTPTVVPPATTTAVPQMPQTYMQL